MTKSDCKFIQFAFRNKIYEAFYLTLCRNGYTYLSRDLYISCDVYTVYVRPNLVVLVFVRPNSSYVRPKLKVIGQMSCQVKYLFAALYSIYCTLWLRAGHYWPWISVYFECILANKQGIDGQWPPLNSRPDTIILIHKIISVIYNNIVKLIVN